MYIGDYLKQREGATWTAEDTAEVMRIFREVDAVAAGVYRSATADREWLMKMAQKEDGCMISVGGLICDLERYADVSGSAGTPCARCGKPRTREQGSEIFTVCDDCWNLGKG